MNDADCHPCLRPGVTAALLVILSFASPAIASAPPEDEWANWDYESDEEPVLTTEELRGHFHDLVVGPLPIRFHGSVSAGTRSPYYALGTAIEADYLPLPWLRLAAMVGMGAQFLDNPTGDLFFATAAEAWVGLRVLGVDRMTTIDVPPRVGTAPRVTSTSAPLRASVPSYHAVYIEGGVANGIYATNECVGSCDADWGPDREVADRRFRLWTHGVGVRYVYQRYVDSQHFLGSGVRAVDLYVQYFFPPLAAPGFAMYDSNGWPAPDLSWGLRGGISFPACRDGRCVQITAGGGMSSVRWLPFVEGGVGYHFRAL